MVVRSWTGWTETVRAADYEAYMHEVALPGYADIEGNLGVLMLRRDLDDKPWTEFTMISLWESLADIRRFAGDDPTVAVFYQRDDDFLVDRERTVRHYEVFGSTPRLGVPAAHGDSWGSPGRDL
ncbi:MAG: hypothetical protein ACXV2J_01445 [Actinomycetes bacterium]